MLCTHRASACRAIACSFPPSTSSAPPLCLALASCSAHDLRHAPPLGRACGRQLGSGALGGKRWAGSTAAGVSKREKRESNRSRAQEAKAFARPGLGWHRDGLGGPAGLQPANQRSVGRRGRPPRDGGGRDALLPPEDPVLARLRSSSNTCQAGPSTLTVSLDLPSGEETGSRECEPTTTAGWLTSTLGSLLASPHGDRGLSLDLLAKPYLQFLGDAPDPQVFASRFSLLFDVLPLGLLGRLISLHEAAAFASPASYAVLLRHSSKLGGGNERTPSSSGVDGYLLEMRERSMELDVDCWSVLFRKALEHGEWDSARSTLRQASASGMGLSKTAWLQMLWTRSAPGKGYAAPMEQFVRGWQWQLPDGRAAVAAVRRLCDEGHWDLALAVAEETLFLQNPGHATESTVATGQAPVKADAGGQRGFGPASCAVDGEDIDRVWAAELLKALVEGLRRRRLGLYVGASERGYDGPALPLLRLLAPLTLARLASKENPAVAVSGPFEDSDRSSAFDFVHKFMDRHRRWDIRPDHTLLALCLRDDGTGPQPTPPSSLFGVVSDWTACRGTEPSKFGSVTAVRMLHHCAAWLERSRGSPRLAAEARAVRGWYASQGADMLRRGPVDGRYTRGHLCWYASQATYSVDAALARVRKACASLGGTGGGGGDGDGVDGFERPEGYGSGPGCVKERRGVMATDRSEAEERVYRWWAERPGRPRLMLRFGP